MGCISSLESKEGADEKQKSKKEIESLSISHGDSIAPYLKDYLEALEKNSLIILDLLGNLSFLSLTHWKQIVRLEPQEQPPFLNH